MKLAYKSNRGGGSRGQVHVASADSSKMRGIGGVGTMEPVLYGRRLWMGGGSVLVPVWRSLGDGFTGKGELDLWVARAGT